MMMMMMILILPNLLIPSGNNHMEFILGTWLGTAR